MQKFTCHPVYESAYMIFLNTHTHACENVLNQVSSLLLKWLSIKKSEEAFWFALLVFINIRLRCAKAFHRGSRLRGISLFSVTVQMLLMNTRVLR